MNEWIDDVIAEASRALDSCAAVACSSDPGVGVRMWRVTYEVTLESGRETRFAGAFPLCEAHAHMLASGELGPFEVRAL